MERFATLLGCCQPVIGPRFRYGPTLDSTPVPALILFSDKRQTPFIGKAPLKASPICAKSADAVSCRLRRADALGKADSLCFSWESGMILKPDKKLEKLFIAQGASGFYETA